MTDKEKLEAIRAEIHRLVDVRGYDREIANDLFAFMDSLPNEPVSEDLEKAAKEHSFMDGSEDVDEYARYNLEKYESFKTGAKWQKQQDQATIELAEDHAMLAGMEKMKEEMKAKAIDATCFGFQGAALFTFRLPAGSYLVGSKVKVIVIKED